MEHTKEAWLPAPTLWVHVPKEGFFKDSLKGTIRVPLRVLKGFQFKGTCTKIVFTLA